MWITNGGFADVYIVFAKVDGEKFTAFIVERTFPGFKAGTKSTRWAFTAARQRRFSWKTGKVPKETLLHEIGRGHIVAFNILNAGTIYAGSLVRRRIEARAHDFFEVLQRAQSLP